MDLKKIRSMNDEELIFYLKHIQNRTADVCNICNKEATKIIKIENTDTFQTKKLCGICEECYSDLLNTLKTSDLDWR